jgi:hypothetical protein
MFSYSPIEANESGRILAAGQVGAAQANSQMMGQLGNDIGGALKSLGGSFAGAIEQRNEDEGAYAALQSLGDMFPAFNKVVKSLDQFDPRTRRVAARSITSSMLGPLSQFAMAGMASGMRSRASIAGGEGTVPLPSDPPPYSGSPVEPPFPTDEPLPPVATQASPMTGAVPSPDALSAADAWYKNSAAGSIGRGSIKPFWR